MQLHLIRNHRDETIIKETLKLFCLSQISGKVILTVYVKGLQRQHGKIQDKNLQTDSDIKEDILYLQDYIDFLINCRSILPFYRKI